MWAMEHYGVTPDIVTWGKGLSAGLAVWLIAHADRGGFSVTDVGVTEPTLETVFIALTGKDLRE